MKTQNHLSLSLSLALAACGGAEPKPADTAAPAEASASAEATKKADSPAAPSVDLPGIPAAPKLAPLAKPGGPKAEGNVPSDVQAALGAKSCKIKDGQLDNCPASDAFHTERNNFVKAKAPAHVQTLLNLLGAEEPQVRLLVLEAHPVRYIDVYEEERKSDPKLYEPLISAALAEKHPDLRESFAYEVSEIPVLSVHQNLIPYVGALGETYSDEEGAKKIVDTLADLWGEDCTPCRDAILGIAARNADENARTVALSALDNRDLPDATFCPLLLANIHPKEEAYAGDVAGIFTRDVPDCSAHYDAWFATFPGKAKDGTLSADAVHAVVNLMDHEKGQAFKPKIVALGKELQSIIKEEGQLRYAAEDLANVE